MSDLKQYVMRMKVEAGEMTRGDYNKMRGWELPENEDGSDEGYVVVSSSKICNVEGFVGHVSWSPKKLFEMNTSVPNTSGRPY